MEVVKERVGETEAVTVGVELDEWVEERDAVKACVVDSQKLGELDKDDKADREEESEGEGETDAVSVGVRVPVVVNVALVL